jgi:hypothetical protein
MAGYPPRDRFLAGPPVYEPAFRLASHSEGSPPVRYLPGRWAQQIVAGCPHGRKTCDDIGDGNTHNIGWLCRT